MKRFNLDLVQAQRTLKTVLMAAAFAAAVFVPDVFAQSTNFGGTDTKVCGFFSNINGLLNIDLVRIVPEEAKAKRIPINADQRPALEG